MKTLPEWIKEIETKRLENERDAANEQRQASAEYYDKVQGLQLEVLKKMIERNHPDEDINYIFLSKCGWDDNYPIDELGEEYTYEDVLLKLVEKYRSEAKFYEEKVAKILEEKQGGNK